MGIDVFTTYQIKRRQNFKICAEGLLRSYSEQSFEKVKAELKNSGYEEWNEDYHAMISQGTKIKSLTTNEFRVFVQAVYGWMPVMYSQQSIKILRKNILSILSGKRLSHKIINDSSRCFTSNKHSAGSISAFSKVLHFCSPENFPVWDTRVARALGRKTGTGNNTDIYLDYLSVMSELQKDLSLSGYYKNYKKVIDPKATRLRALEHGLYFKG